MPPNSAQSHLRAGDLGEAEGLVPLDKSVANKYVVSHSWDLFEVNFLACYTKSEDQRSALISLFVHEDLGVVVHGSQPASDTLDKLIAVEIPFLVTLEMGNEEDEKARSPCSAYTSASIFCIF